MPADNDSTRDPKLEIKAESLVAGAPILEAPTLKQHQHLEALPLSAGSSGANAPAPKEKIRHALRGI
jgi:hypothetical protein